MMDRELKRGDKIYHLSSFDDYGREWPYIKERVFKYQEGCLIFCEEGEPIGISQAYASPYSLAEDKLTETELDIAHHKRELRKYKEQYALLKSILARTPK